jgi:hypothetical protein
MTILTYLPSFAFIAAAAAAATILYGLNRALADASWPASDRQRTLRISAIVLLGWLALSIVLAASGAYQAGSGDIPTIQYGILVPILIGSLLLWRSETVARILEAVPQRYLIGVQLYRALGGIFLVLYASGKLPGLFALPAGIGDIAIGLLAPVVALAYARAPSDTAGLVRTWNVLGILDLVVAVTTGFITAPSLIQPVVTYPNSEMMTVLPMALIPLFLVPLAIVLHIASLTKLHRATAPKGNRMASASA